MRFVNQRLADHSNAPRINLQVLLVLRLDCIDLLLRQLLRVQGTDEELRKPVQGTAELGGRYVEIVLGGVSVRAGVCAATVTR